MSFSHLLAQRAQKTEDWRYTRLDSFEKQSFTAAQPVVHPSLPDPVTPVRLVFVNGFFRPDLSQLDALPPDFLTQDGAGGYALRIASQTCLALQPLGLLFWNEPEAAPAEAGVRLSLTLGANSRLTVIEKHAGPAGAAFGFYPELDVKLEPQAKLVHGKLVLGTAASLHAAQTRVQVAGGAFYDHFALVRDGGLTRCAMDVHLTGELAAAHLSGVSLLRGAGQGDHLVRVFHEAPYGTSRQVFKTVLDDKARGVFQGRIHVAAQAQKTDGHQLSRALMLSDRAEMNAKPELEIYADDVKCSHGSAIGDLSEQELFYLRSRGLSEAQARALLVEAFAGELIDQIQSPELANAAREEAAQWLKHS